MDLSACDGRYFAIQLGRRTDRIGLLVAAGLPIQTNTEIYVRDMPWPLPANTFVELGHGDLVQFVPEQQTVAVVTSLADMLASPTHWRFVASALTAFLGDTWVLHDDGAFRHQVRPERRNYSRQDIATRLGILASDLVVQLPKPRIHDFWRRGQPTMNVLYAVWAPGCTSATDFDEAVCFVDLRPVLGGLYAARCPDYCFDVQALLDRFIGRCPPGLQVQAERRGVLLSPHERALPVSSGDVITVFVLPEALLTEWRQGGGGPPGPPPSPGRPGPDEPAGDARSHSTASAPVAASQATDAEPVSSTGGSTARQLCANRSPPIVCRGRGIRNWVFLLSLACWPSCALAGRGRQETNVIQLHHAQGETCVDLPGDWRDSDRNNNVETRPLPTPCRSRGKVPPRDPSYPLGPTLLEQSVAQSQGRVFWEACTLLEALLEHFHLDDDVVEGPRTVRLCGAVCGPSPSHDIREVFVLAGIHWQPLILPAASTYASCRRVGPITLGGLTMPFTFLCFGPARPGLTDTAQGRC